MDFSGMITTNLGKSATFAKDAGRDIRVHHSKSLPLLIFGERFFFGAEAGRIFATVQSRIRLKNNRLDLIKRIFGHSVRSSDAVPAAAVPGWIGGSDGAAQEPGGNDGQG
jgi:hypothetical protein